MTCENHTKVAKYILDQSGGSAPVAVSELEFVELHTNPWVKDLFPLDANFFNPDNREIVEDTNKFFGSLFAGKVPERPRTVLNGCISGHFAFSMMNYYTEHDLAGTPKDFMFAFKNVLTKNGMWSVVDKTTAKNIADRIRGKKVLEVMAGSGWWAKALQEEGIDIISTDDFSTHQNKMQVHPVVKMNALDAVKKFGESADVLFVSYPPYGDNTISEVCKLWGEDKDIIYIGEVFGNCATDEFFSHLTEVEEIEDIINQINHRDHCYITRWSNEPVYSF